MRQEAPNRRSGLRPGRQSRGPPWWLVRLRGFANDHEGSPEARAQFLVGPSIVNDRQNRLLESFAVMAPVTANKPITPALRGS
jgi:hypothetical protein